MLKWLHNQRSHVLRDPNRVEPLPLGDDLIVEVSQLKIALLNVVFYAWPSLPPTRSSRSKAALCRDTAKAPPHAALKIQLRLERSRSRICALPIHDVHGHFYYNKHIKKNKTSQQKEELKQQSRAQSQTTLEYYERFPFVFIFYSHFWVHEWECLTLKLCGAWITALRKKTPKYIHSRATTGFSFLFSFFSQFETDPR